MKTFSFLLPALLLTTSACKKEQTELEKLPDATQTGTGSAGFLLDGVAWLPEASNLSTGSPSSASWQRTVAGRSLRVSSSRYIDRTTLQIFLPHIKQGGVFQLNQSANPPSGFSNPSYSMFIMSKSLTVPRIFLTGPTATGTVTVTRFDTVARVVSGTFELTVQEETSPETHRLTDGRFDLTF
ncbi:hypothetical protein [Hymenobacter sediminicola]|uniref:Uncharacterized protein n=1 Tax=Hymenobacter sediminicola TaxID=2761579 RepID=A0A7G7W5F1_9BACT|nr:hypothetical protein [Hymenobacter sediminicola]QNH61594.1 hypothetical protein H4317_15735 [Hymenobacter sediminicola]